MIDSEWASNYDSMRLNHCIYSDAVNIDFLDLTALFSLLLKLTIFQWS